MWPSSRTKALRYSRGTEHAVSLDDARPVKALRARAARPDAVPEAAVDANRFLSPDHERWPGHWASKPEPWPEERLLAAETRELVDRAIEQLPPAQRAVISLRDVEGWSSEETRNALGVSETNQRVLLHRARSKVRQALEDYLMESQ